MSGAGSSAAGSAASFVASFVDLAALSIHDVKNRLAAMAARAELKGDSETLSDALRAAAELTRLLACYKADAGQLGVQIDAYCPADLVTDLIAENRPLNQLDIVVKREHLPELWFYDDHLVRMVLANALQNALRFARQRITLRVVASEAWLEFTIADDGEGYPDELLANPLLMSALTRQGAGIGLYLAHKVAALHANHGLVGSIALRNDSGAVFCLRLPK
jgi:signal transduction histidine kinase